MSTASLPTKHAHVQAGKNTPQPLNTVSEHTELIEASQTQPEDDTLTDIGSDTEIEDRYESSARLMRQEAEDELAYRPKNGYGQRPWASPIRTRFQKPMYNVTIGFARHMQEQGLDIEALPLQQRLIIQEMLGTDRKIKEKEASEAAEAAAAKFPKVRPHAVDVFSGIIPPKKRPLHWGRKEHFSGMKNHFNSLQFRRALYEDGVDDVEGLKAMSTDALVTMWMQRRVELHSGLGYSQHAGTEESIEGGYKTLVGGTENVLQVPTAEEPAHGPISMAAIYSYQESQAAYEFPDAGLPTRPSAPTFGNGIPTADTGIPIPLATSSGNRQIEENFTNTTVLNPFVSPKPILSTDPTAMAEAIPAKHGRGRRKHKEPDPEKARREAVAARVDRYPLSIPGNNKGEPLSMNLKMSAFTIKQKYNLKMTKQLLEDYGILPTDPKDLSPHEKLAEHLVKEREKLIKSGAKLQEPWTHDRLEAYVAAQEAKGAIVSAAFVPGDGSIHTQLSLHSSTEKFDSTTGYKSAYPHSASGTSFTKKKRTRETADFENDEFGTLSHKRLRKGAKIETVTQNTLLEPQISSAHVPTAYDASFHSRPLGNEPLYGSALHSNAYAHPTLHSPQQFDQSNWNHRFQELQNDNTQPPQWSNVGRWAYEQESVDQDDHTTSNFHQNEFLQSSQVFASTYTMPSVPFMANNMAKPSIPDILIDPDLLDL
ncbi:hypothetical protein PMIN06_008241 [Paraphaeosphaeria minitans]